MYYKKIFFLTSILITLHASPLDIINTIRLKSGATPLHYNAKLALAAKKHALYIAKTQNLGHYEDSSSPYFYGTAPWDRVVKAGFGTAMVVENISFYEPNFKRSIEKIMGTVYHRLAFLFLQADSIGYASVYRIYVYELSNSKVAALCKRHFKNAAMIIDRVCPNSSDIIPATLFNKAMNRLQKRAKSVVIYPYRDQKGVPTSGVEETPQFRYSRFGFPITITFNSSYYSSVKLKTFQLFQGGKEIAGEVVDSTNDLHNKIRKGTFVFAPLNPLEHKKSYRVKVVAIVDGKRKIVEWSFETR